MRVDIENGNAFCYCSRYVVCAKIKWYHNLTVSCINLFLHLIFSASGLKSDVTVVFLDPDFL